MCRVKYFQALLSRRIEAQRGQRWSSFMAIALMAMASGGGVQSQTIAPSIITVPELHAAAGSEAALAIAIHPTKGVPPQAVLMVKGLPAEVELSEGRHFPSGIWIVPQKGFVKLTMRVSPKATRGAVLTIALTTLEGSHLAETSLTLIIETPPAGPGAPNSLSRPGDGGKEARPTATTSPSGERGLALKLLEKADRYLQAGNIILARQLYQGAAERGLAEAALSLAQTYDPQELSKRGNLVGVQADPKLATKWYEKAKELASGEFRAQMR